MKILVTGGTGFIGTRLVARLVEHGHECILLSRHIRALPAEEPRISYIHYQHLFEAPAVDAVINLAGESVGERWTQEKKRRILSSRVERTRQLVQWMESLLVRPKVFLSGSAVGIYGDRPGEVLTEASRPDPAQKFRFQVCSQWEQEALRAVDIGTRTVLMRVGNVLDTSGGLIGTVLPTLRKVPFLMPIAPSSRFAWVGLEDAVRLIEFALNNDQIEGPLNIVAPESVDMRTFTQELGRLAGKPVFGALPAFVARIALGEMGQAITDSQDVRPAEALARGFKFEQEDIRDALGR